jgi:hypothetical protein
LCQPALHVQPSSSGLPTELQPPSETITNIDDFIWRMCASYRKLNSVTLPFEYPIGRCDDSSDNFGDSHGQLWFIRLAAAPVSTKSLSTLLTARSSHFSPLTCSSIALM